RNRAVARFAMTGQINEMQGASAFQAFDQRCEHRRGHGPAMQEHDVRSVMTAGFDVEIGAHAARTASDKASSSVSTSASSCAAENVTLKRAVSFGTAGGRIAMTRIPCC